MGPQTVDAMTEVKTGHQWLSNITNPEINQLSKEDKKKYLGYFQDLKEQTPRELSVANHCGLKYILVFDNDVAANAAKKLSAQASLPLGLDIFYVP